MNDRLLKLYVKFQNLVSESRARIWSSTHYWSR